MQSLSIIEENPLDFADWVDADGKNPWVSRTLKIFLFTQKNFSNINKWCRWPEMFHASDDYFFNKASQAIEVDVEDFDNFLLKKAEEFNLEQMSSEQMARLECLVELIGGEAKCDPECDDVDSSICQFIMFIMKDALQFLGLAGSDK